MIEINKYDEVLDGDYKNYFSKGYTVLSNDIISCDRLTSSEKILLIYLIRQYRIVGPSFKIKKWKLEKATNLTSRTIHDLMKSLKEKCFITDFKVEGGFNGNYQFTLVEYVHLTPHILLSEFEQNFLDIALKKLKKKKDFTKAIGITEKVIKEGLDSTFFDKLNGGFKEYLGNVVESSLLEDLGIEKRASMIIEKVNKDLDNFDTKGNPGHSNFIDLIEEVRKEYTFFLLDLLKKEISIDV